jgi:hypothetical protein
MAAIFSKLDAVNRILRAGGEHPVSALSSTSGDALLAEQMLNEQNWEYQMVGLVCNTEVQDLELNSDNEIELPDNLLHIELRNTTKMTFPRGHEPVKLYNATDQTYDFSEFPDTPLTAVMVLGVDFEDLPFPIKLAICDEAARRYQMFNVGDQSMDGLLREIWIQSRLKARATDIRQRQMNLFRNIASSLPYEAAKQTRRRGWGSSGRFQ